MKDPINRTAVEKKSVKGYFKPKFTHHPCGGDG